MVRGTTVFSWNCSPRSSFALESLPAHALAVPEDRAARPLRGDGASRATHRDGAAQRRRVAGGDGRGPAALLPGRELVAVRRAPDPHQPGALRGRRISRGRSLPVSHRRPRPRRRRGVRPEPLSRNLAPSSDVRSERGQCSKAVLVPDTDLTDVVPRRSLRTTNRETDSTCRRRPGAGAGTTARAGTPPLSWSE